MQEYSNLRAYREDLLWSKFLVQSDDFFRLALCPVSFLEPRPKVIHPPISALFRRSSSFQLPGNSLPINIQRTTNRLFTEQVGHNFHHLLVVLRMRKRRNEYLEYE